MFIPFNLVLNYGSEGNREPSLCLLQMKAVESLRLPAGQIHFECEGKKVEFFLILVYIQIGIQAAVRFEDQFILFQKCKAIALIFNCS